jgi:hypothetical protein
MKIKLFLELKKSQIFHFYDKPGRKLVKSDSSHYVGPEGRRRISPTVLVVEDKDKRGGKDERA